MCRWLGQGCRIWTYSGCGQRVPEHLRDQVRVECDAGPGYLTIVECRPPWRKDFGPEWTRFPIARLRYTSTTRRWALY